MRSKRNWPNCASNPAAEARTVEVRCAAGGVDTLAELAARAEALADAAEAKAAS
jgi:hypothetical protein